MSEISDSLLQAYLSTSYEVDLPNGRIALRIGEKSHELDEFLRKYGYQSWAFITAYNPGSKPLSEPENSARYQQLKSDIEGQGLPYFHGSGCPADDQWKPEPSLLILGISHTNARILGLQYEQVAIVAGNRGDIAKLIFCTSG